MKRKKLLSFLLAIALMMQSGAALATDIDIDVGDEEITEEIIVDNGTDTTEEQEILPEEIEGDDDADDGTDTQDEKEDEEEESTLVEEIDVSAEEESAQTVDSSDGTCGDNLTWTLDDAGTLTISGTGAMTNYSSSSKAPWYELRG